MNDKNKKIKKIRLSKKSLIVVSIALGFWLISNSCTDAIWGSTTSSVIKQVNTQIEEESNNNVNKDETDSDETDVNPDLPTIPIDEPTPPTRPSIVQPCFSGNPVFIGLPASPACTSFVARWVDRKNSAVYFLLYSNGAADMTHANFPKAYRWEYTIAIDYNYREVHIYDKLDKMIYAVAFDKDATVNIGDIYQIDTKTSLLIDKNKPYMRGNYTTK